MSSAFAQSARRRFDLVVCDIDGCLAPESSTPMDAAALAAVAEHNARARRDMDRPLVTLCSGRPQPFVEAMSKLIANTEAPCVAENGVWVYHPATNGYDMDPAITREHRRAVRDASAWLEDTLGPKGFTQQPGKSASISLYHPVTANLAPTLPTLRDAFNERGWPLRVSMTWLYINCDLEHVSKGTGLDRVLARLGLPRERVAGIGDTLSDVAIRERVGTFGCPANADTRLKPQADLVSEHVEAAGVLDLLAQLSR